MKMPNKFTYLALLSILCLLLLFVALGCSEQPSADQGDMDTYIIGDEEGDWGYPSPYGAYPRGPGYVRMSYLFDTLIWKDEDGFTEALAEDWSFDEEELLYTFHLQDDVKWHDGRPFSAEDVVFTYEYLEENPYPWFDLDMVEEVNKVDERKVEIKLGKPYAAFLNNVVGVMPILPGHIWEDVEEPEDFTEPEAVVGTGPFRLEDYNREQGQYHYEANPEYHLGEPVVERLLMVKVSEPHLALQRGDVDYAMVEPEAIDTLEGAGFVVEPGLHDWNLKLMFNHQEQPFEDNQFRQGLAHAIDLEEVVERALRGHGLPGSSGMVSPDSQWFAGQEKLPDYDYDLDTARGKLEELGFTYQNGSLKDHEGEPLKVEMLTMARFSREGELISGQLEELGLEVENRAVESSVLDNRIRNWDFDLAVTGHGGVGGDPEGFRNFMIGEASPHINARYEHSELEDILEKQARELDETSRQELVTDIQKIYAEELPAYTLHYPTYYYAYREDKVDWFFTPDGMAMGIPMPLNKLALIE